MQRFFQYLFLYLCGYENQIQVCNNRATSWKITHLIWILLINVVRTCFIKLSPFVFYTRQLTHSHTLSSDRKWVSHAPVYIKISNQVSLTNDAIPLAVRLEIKEKDFEEKTLLSIFVLFSCFLFDYFMFWSH